MQAFRENIMVLGLWVRRFATWFRGSRAAIEGDLANRLRSQEGIAVPYTRVVLMIIYPLHIHIYIYTYIHIYIFIYLYIYIFIPGDSGPKATFHGLGVSTCDIECCLRNRTVEEPA